MLPPMRPSPIIPSCTSSAPFGCGRSASAPPEASKHRAPGFGGEPACQSWRPSRRPTRAPRKMNRVLMIGLDAAEVTLVQRWMQEGALPNLRRMVDRGAFGQLGSTAEWLVGSPWPSFYSGQPPEEHGLYHYLVWRPDRMNAARPTREWLPIRPFWRRIAESGRRVIAVDVPIAYAPDEFPGLEISGWATHETLEPPSAHPPELLDWARKTFGSLRFDDEQNRPLSAAELLAVRDQCVRTARTVADLGVALMRREAWDLFLICFASTHRGGHALWSSANLAGEASPQQATALKAALKDVYVACDEAVGKLVEQAGPETISLVFSLHGMGPNTARADLLREMLERIVSDEQGEGQPRIGLARRLRGVVPLRVRAKIKQRLPHALQDRLTQFWRTGGIDWSQSRAFQVFGDLEGYIRVNLRGRESAGIVEPGREYEELCERLADGLRTFVDEDTGEPVVGRIGRRETLYPTGSRSALLPDMIVRWSPTPAADHRMIVSRRYGSIPWPTPGRHPQGRSGNHLGKGFLIAAGDAVPVGSTMDHAHILDIAPTVYGLLGLRAPDEMRGRSLLVR